MKIRAVLAAFLLTLGGAAAVWGQATVKVAVPPGGDIGAQVNAAIAALAGKAGTLELPAGSYTQWKTISVSGTGIRIIGSGSGTILNYNPASYHLIDSADSSEGWRGSGVNVRVETSIGEDHPDPMQGSGYIEAATLGGSDHRVSKAIPSTNFTGWAKLGIWVSLNFTRAQEDIQFFISDGTRTAYWAVKPQSIYGVWKLYELDPLAPTGNDGGVPDLKSITGVGFRNLLPNAKYYFDAIALYTPTGPSIAFSSCHQCSLENVSIHWEPASESDAAVSVTQNTRELVLDHVHTTGAARGFDLVGVSDNTCKACSAEVAAENGFAMRGAATGNQLINPEVTRNVNGIFIAQEANHNKIVSARCVKNNAACIVIDGHDNEINDTNIDTWMTFGFVIRGGSRNVVSGVTARSFVGESAVQLLGGASHNTLSNIDIEAAGGSGLDLGGGVKPQTFNTATQVIVRNSGSSSWHGGPTGSSEGRGLCLCGADDNTISHMEIYDTGQRSRALGAEGIIIDGSNRNKLEDILISHSRHEGIAIWHASDNQLINIRVVGNGLKEGSGAGIRIEAPANNTVVENVCYWMNGGGGIKNVSRSSSIRNVHQVKDLDPKQPCQ